MIPGHLPALVFQVLSHLESFGAFNKADVELLGIRILQNEETMSKAKAPIPPLAANEVTRLEFVDDNKNYYVTLQMGSKRSWRNWEGQPRKIEPSNSGGFARVHNPVVFEHIGPFSGRITNGLISHHNEWLKDYNHREKNKWSGHLDRQLLVLETEETADIPDELKSQSNAAASLAGMVGAIVDQKLTAVLGTGV